MRSNNIGQKRISDEEIEKLNNGVIDALVQLFTNKIDEGEYTVSEAIDIIRKLPETIQKPWGGTDIENLLVMAYNMVARKILPIGSVPTLTPGMVEYVLNSVIQKLNSWKKPTGPSLAEGLQDIISKAPMELTTPVGIMGLNIQDKEILPDGTIRIKIDSKTIRKNDELNPFIGCKDNRKGVALPGQKPDEFILGCAASDIDKGDV